MAGDWLKIEKSTPDKPEIEAIATRLDLDLDAVFGKCFRVWKWFDDHTTDGNAPLASMKSIDRQACHPGFADAMVFVGWLVSTENGLRLPNFNRHNPDTAKQRAMTAQRVAKHRAKKTDVTQKTVTRALREHISADDERTIRTRDGNKCVYCGRVDGQYGVGETQRDSIIALDHVIPVTRGGDSTTDNLVCACTVCNSRKTNKTPDEAGLLWPVSNAGIRYGSVTQPLPREEKRREEELKTHAGETLTGMYLRTPLFEEFIRVYPRASAPEAAWDVWQAKVFTEGQRHGKPDAEIEEMIVKAAREFRDSPAGQPPENGQDYRPAAAKWIQGNCWEESRELWQQPNGKEQRQSRKKASTKTADEINQFFGAKGFGSDS